jgi:hypothetical protein
MVEGEGHAYSGAAVDPTRPITLLVPLIGIALILAAVWLTGGAQRARLDRAQVLRRLAEDMPRFAAAELAIAADGGTAIAADAEGSALVLVFIAGDKIVTRRLGRGEVRRVDTAQDLLVIDTGDFAHGRFALGLAGGAERWAARLARLMSVAGVA